MYIKLNGITINRESSLLYNKIYVNGGEYINENTKVTISNAVLNINCNDFGNDKNIVNFNVFIDNTTLQFLISENEEMINAVHIGGVVYDCENKIILDTLKAKNNCIYYQRIFDDSFTDSFNKNGEELAICNVEIGYYEFNNDFNNDFSNQYK